ncbi:MAG: proton-translocating NADH-quinone oxidoreductase, chain [Gemmatimonadetes bacterium]|nr:proton-translocating NADH-quinone oxidoreductase, chain [Gemmatimonadota bacterium]
MNAFLTSIGYMRWILPVLLALPLLGATAIWILSATHDDADGSAAGDEVVSGRAATPRMVALLTFALEFVLSLGLWFAFDPAFHGWQATFDRAWMPVWGIRFTLGLDGIAMMMVLLTTFIMLLSAASSWTSIRTKASSYYALLLVLTTGMLGVFMSLDLFVFYTFWEVMLVPMYFIIGIWGGERRIYASLKFFIYTMIGSLLMLAGIVWLGIAARSAVTGVPNFSYDAIMGSVQLTPHASLWLFGAFFLAFAVKVPMFPFHTWLPDAHVEAPTAGSVVLASIMLKLGTFGFIRLAVPLFPTAAMNPTVRGIILGLAVIGIVYGALVSLVQPDFKKLVAYSSVSHLGFVMLGIFAMTVQSVQGALMVMINHGISTGALFLLIGMIYERRHTRLIEAYGGLARVMPLFAVMLTLTAFSSIGVPGTNGFIGEFLVLIGSFRTYPVLALIATTSVIIAAAYLLWAVQRIIFNPLDKAENEHVPDLNRRELLILAPLMACIIWLGVYPAPVLRRMQVSAEQFVELVQARSATNVMVVPHKGAR